MEIKNSTIMSPNFIPAMNKLLKVEMPVKECIALAEAIDKINDKLKVLETAKKGIMDRFAKKDESGELVTQPTVSDPNLRTPVFESEESAKEFAEEIQKLLDEATELPLEGKITLKGDIQMSTEDFMVVKDLVAIA
jgi:hypothetical protein